MKTLLRLFPSRVALPLLLAGAFCTAHAQSVTNGDLAKGNAGWKGDRVVQIDPDKADNKVLGVELSRVSYQYFSQQIDTGGGKTITLTFDYKVSKDYSGNGFRVQVTLADRTLYYEDYPLGPVNTNCILGACV